MPDPSNANAPSTDIRAWLNGDPEYDDHDTFAMGREFAAAVLAEIDGLRDLLIFADGLAVSMSRQNSAYVTALADLHNETTPRQRLLARAGCWPKGSFRGE